MNLITGQNVSITSDIAGTTTDVVEKTQELLPLGPVVWLDTAGFGDKTELAEQRLAKTRRVLDRADVAVLVCEGNKIGLEEAEIIEEVSARNIPLIKFSIKRIFIRATATASVAMPKTKPAATGCLTN